MKRDFNHLILRPIAHIETEFPEKFGIPRQSGILDGLESTIRFEKEFAKDGILKEIELFSHLILIWGFSEETEDKWSPTIRPPKLGGNKTVGVFASRSPNRPNPLGFSVVRLISVNCGKGFPTLTVSGADMVNGTPIYDIKPYLSYSDSHPEARLGYACPPENIFLDVEIPEELSCQIPPSTLELIRKTLSQDPRPGYKKDGTFFFECFSYHIGFTVDGNKLCVIEMEKQKLDKNHKTVSTKKTSEK